MSEHLCEQCGAANDAGAQFCAKCDFYLGWDSGGGSLGGSPLTSEVPVVRETHSQKFPAVSLSPERPHRTAPPRPGRSTSAVRPAMAPKVVLETPEVELDAAQGGTFDVRIRNTSTIVDGYTVDAPHAPPWLTITPPEIRLLTDEEDVFTVSLSMSPRYNVFVQRLRLPLQITSVEDPAKRTDVELLVVVPRIGGPVAMTAEPHLIRLRDGTTGRFRIRLDNRGSNYPQRFALIGSDLEGVVRFSFRPHNVEVEPMGVQVVDVRFDVPPLEPGQQVPRTLKVTAANNESPVETIVNVAQERSAAPPDRPVQLRLEPSVTRIRDATAADIWVIVDNRRGSRDRRLSFSGRDPEGRVRFAFSQPQLYVRAREQVRLPVHIEAPLPPPGDEVERPFAVVSNDGRDESEATGSLVQVASASPITTAQIRLEPEHVVVRSRRRGRFRVTVDNSRGMQPLGVWLSGSDPEGAVRFKFTPPRLDVPPGNLRRAALRVRASLPGSGKEVAREINVQADDGVGKVEAEGRFTQSMMEILPLIRLLLTLLGGLLMVLGAIRPWFLGGPSYDIGRLGELQQLLEIKALGDLENIQKWETITQPAARALILVLAGVMMLGILSTSGRYTITAGFVAAALIVLYVAFAISRFSSTGPAYGALLVVLGAITGIVGGFCVKRSGLP